MTAKKIQECLPVAPMRFIATRGSEELGSKINEHLVEMRQERIDHKEIINTHIEGYIRDDYRVKYECPRFGSGEGKATIKESIRGTDLYILTDVFNHSNEYRISNNVNNTSPDDMYQDLKRIIAATCGTVHRINVIMPMLYEGRQHRRTMLESLDCAIMLQELEQMGMENIITFDAHDPRVQNAIPIRGFDNFFTSYQFMASILEKYPDIVTDSDHLMMISPDEGGMSRSVYYANILGIDMGMFYKRRDYSVVVDGRNPIVAHEFLGNSVEGKDVIIVDDMISSGESMLDVAYELKKRRAKRIFVATTFGLFNKGLESFDRYYEEGVFDHIFTTNLTYTPPEVLERPYYTQVDLSKYIALIIDTLNHDTSVNDIMNPTQRIHEMLQKRDLKK
ncbi:ribose-phosphate pyrophosphokinase [Anaerolentibacter hominis]|uniref:ribose-phosphate pyrophosphokinase n=1 Tax=Anaerolentibacter hominis TaxID=3079009 RepID=UPI0031B82203